ncbi:hypothetical protein PMIN03_008802 [Paraphaeosphaeria minitans]
MLVFLGQPMTKRCASSSVGTLCNAHSVLAYSCRIGLLHLIGVFRSSFSWKTINGVTNRIDSPWDVCRKTSWKSVDVWK